MFPVLRRLLPHRQEALHAVALVAARGEDLAPGLARLAADDRLLGPWARRLLRAAERSARRGESGTGTVLHRAGLLEPAEAAFIDEAERASDASAALRHLAQQGGFRVPGLHLVEWFPLWLLGTMLVAILSLKVVAGLIGFTSVLADIGVRGTYLGNLVFDAPFVSLILPGGVLLLLVWSLLLASARLPGQLAMARRFWYLPIAREACTLRLLYAARQRSLLDRLPGIKPVYPWWLNPEEIRRDWLVLYASGLPLPYLKTLKTVTGPDALLRCVGLLPLEREATVQEWDDVQTRILGDLQSRLANRLGLYRFILIDTFVLMWLVLFHSIIRGSYLF